MAVTFASNAGTPPRAASWAPYRCKQAALSGGLFDLRARAPRSLDGWCGDYARAERGM